MKLSNKMRSVFPRYRNEVLVPHFIIIMRQYNLSFMDEEASSRLSKEVPR